MPTSAAARRRTNSLGQRPPGQGSEDDTRSPSWACAHKNLSPPRSRALPITSQTLKELQAELGPEWAQAASMPRQKRPGCAGRERDAMMRAAVEKGDLGLAQRILAAPSPSPASPRALPMSPSVEQSLADLARLAARTGEERDQALDRLARLEPSVARLQRREEEWVNREADLRMEIQRLQHDLDSRDSVAKESLEYQVKQLEGECKRLSDELAAQKREASQYKTMAETEAAQRKKREAALEQELALRNKREEQWKEEVTQLRRQAEAEVERSSRQMLEGEARRLHELEGLRGQHHLQHLNEARVKQLEEDLAAEVARRFALEHELQNRVIEERRAAESEVITLRKAAEGETAALWREVDELRDSRSAIEAERRVLQQSNEELQEQLGVCLSERSELQRRRRMDERTIRDFQEQVGQLRRERRALQEELQLAGQRSMDAAKTQATNAEEAAELQARLDKVMVDMKAMEEKLHRQQAAEDELQKQREIGEGLSEQIDKLTAENKRLEKEVKALQQEGEQSALLLTERQHLDATIERLRRENEAARAIMREKEQMEGELSRITSEFRQLQQKEAQESRDLERVTGELSSARETLGARSTEIQALRRELEALLKERDAVAHEADLSRSLQEQAERRARETDRWVLEAERLQKKLDGLPATPEEWEAERARLERRVEECSLMHEEELRRSDAIHARQCNDMLQRIDEVERQLAAKERELLEVSQEATRLRLAVREQEDREKELKMLRSEADHLRRENADLKADVDRAFRCDRRKESDMRKAFEDLKSSYDDLAARNETYRDQLKAATREYLELEAHLERVEGEHQRLQQEHHSAAQKSVHQTHQTQHKQQALLKDIQTWLLEMHAKAVQRGNSESTPLKPLKADLETILHNLGRPLGRHSRPSSPRHSPVVPYPQ